MKEIPLFEARLSNSTILHIKLDGIFIILETQVNIKTINLLQIESIEMYKLDRYYYIKLTTINGNEYDIGGDENWDQQGRCLEAHKFIRDYWTTIIGE